MRELGSEDVSIAPEQTEFPKESKTKESKRKAVNMCRRIVSPATDRWFREKELEMRKFSKAYDQPRVWVVKNQKNELPTS